VTECVFYLQVSAWVQPAIQTHISCGRDDGTMVVVFVIKHIASLSVHAHFCLLSDRISLHFTLCFTCFHLYSLYCSLRSARCPIISGICIALCSPFSPHCSLPFALYDLLSSLRSTLISTLCPSLSAISSLRSTRKDNAAPGVQQASHTQHTRNTYAKCRQPSFVLGLLRG
jgi:hypothetical protein